MAELPKYQQTGRVTPDMPQLDFANVKEAFRASQSMTQGLDKIASFAFGKMGEQAEQDAVKNAISQPLTLEQIQQANEKGQSIDDLIGQVGGGEIYQDTYRKFQGKQLRSQIEVAAKQAMVSVNSQVKLNQLNDLDEIKSKYDSIITGMVKPLTALSPEESVIAQQSLSVTASAFYKSNIEKLETDYLNDQEYLAKDNVKNSLESIATVMDVATSPEILNEYFINTRDSIYAQARSVSSEFAETQVKQFEENYNELKTDYIVAAGQDSKYAGNMLEAVNRMRDGDLGKATVVYNSMTKEEQGKARAAVIAAWDELYVAEGKEQANLKRQKEEDNEDAIIEFYSSDTSNKRKRELSKYLFKEGVISQSVLDAGLNPDRGAATEDGLAYGRAQVSVITGEIRNEIELRLLHPNLSAKQIGKLLPSIASAVEKKARTIIANNAGASTDLYAVNSDNTIKKVLTITKIYEEIKSEKQPDGTYPSSIDAANQAAKKWKDSTAENNEKIKNVKEAISRKFGDFNTITMTVDKYIKEKKLDSEEAKSFRSLIKSLKDLEGPK
tara:strand:+ start:8527 stop:10191 length:1665 start_codon:yes stop_codon:yes gene_type:complete